MKKTYLIALAFVLLSCSTNIESIPISNTSSEIDDSSETSVFSESKEENSIIEESESEQISMIDKSKPYFEISNYLNGKLNIMPYNVSNLDWIGIYPYNGEPGSMNAMTWVYVKDKEELEIDISLLKGNNTYNVYLCKDNGNYVLFKDSFYLESIDMNDYGVKEALFDNGIEDETYIPAIAITPSTSKKLTYEIYYANNGKRLNNYTYLKSFTSNNSERFIIELSSNLCIPSEANQIEVAIKEGHSKSYFIDIDDSLKVDNSKYLYSFNVMSDLHIRTKDNNERAHHYTHFLNAIEDMLKYNKDSKGLFLVGDSVDQGKEEYYQSLKELVDYYKEQSSVDVHFTLGNHEYIYFDDFTQQLSLFKQYTNVEDIFYTIEMEGSTCIMLGSDTNKGEGTINQAHINWLKEQLDNANPNKPIFIFLHQPLIDTVSGSFEEQNWYGINTGVQIKELLANYPNAYMFTGHTHWQYESIQPMLISNTGCSYINLASVGYLWNDDDASEPGSEGLFIDVYEDYLVIKVREFFERKWVSYGYLKINLNK